MPMAGVALADSARGLLGETRFRGGPSPSESLITAIDSLLSLCGVEMETISAVAVSIGPGSFTGLRVGLATAQGLTFGTDRPIVPVSTLQALSAAAAPSELPISPVVRARTDEVYTGRFVMRRGFPARVFPDRAMTPEEFLGSITEPTVFTGDWAADNRDRIRRRLGPLARFADRSGMLGSPAQIALLGLQRLRRGRLPNPERIRPVYLKRSQAEIKWKERRRKS